jgi:hypothetical protein
MAEAGDGKELTHPLQCPDDDRLQIAEPTHLATLPLIVF